MQFAFYYSTQGCDLLYKASSFLDNKMHKYVWTWIAKLLFINELKQDQLFDLNILESFVKFNIKFMHIWEQLVFLHDWKTQRFLFQDWFFTTVNICFLQNGKARTSMFLVVLTIISYRNSLHYQYKVLLRISM